MVLVTTKCGHPSGTAGRFAAVDQVLALAFKTKPKPSASCLLVLAQAKRALGGSGVSRSSPMVGSPLRGQPLQAKPTMVLVIGDPRCGHVRI